MAVEIETEETFNDHFGEFVGWRTAMANEVLKDPEYRAAHVKESQIEEKIKQLLGEEEGFRLINEYCNTYSTRWRISEQHAYKQGIADGIRLCVETGLINK